MCLVGEISLSPTLEYGILCGLLMEYRQLQESEMFMHFYSPLLQKLFVVLKKNMRALLQKIFTLQKVRTLNKGYLKTCEQKLNCTNFTNWMDT